MMNKLYVAKIVYSTSTDGVGLRNSIYLSGCDIHCPGCHNKDLWDIYSGKEMTIEDVFNKLNQDEFNISILGGEPLMQYDGVLELCKLIKERTDKNIWLWTGRDMHDIILGRNKILFYVDYVVDGPFDQKLRDTSLRFRGSSNQHIWHIERCNDGTGLISLDYIE